MKTFKEFIGLQEADLTESIQNGQYVIIENPRSSNKYVVKLITGPLKSWSEVENYKTKNRLEFGLNTEHNVLILNKGELYTVHHSTRDAANPVPYTNKNLEDLKAHLKI